MFINQRQKINPPLTLQLLLIFILFGFIAFSSCAEAEKDQEKIYPPDIKNVANLEKAFEKPPGFSGQFYPSDPENLRGMIQRFLKHAVPEKESGRLLALVCPHAGYIYSGQIAAYSYKILENEKIDTVILIGPSHRFPLQGVSVWPKGIYKTPLGDVMINEKIATRLAKSSKYIKFESKAHLNEHSLEVQIPFLQTVLKDFRIVPILVNRLTPDALNDISRELASLLANPGTILIASTDLSHYHPYNEANTLDKNTLSAILRGDADELNAMLEKAEAELCGETSILLLLQTLKHINRPLAIKLLKYANSGDTSGMKEKVVGYAAISITLQDNKAIDLQGTNENGNQKNFSDKKTEKTSDIIERGDKKLTDTEDLLNDQEKKKLFKIARKSITEYLTGQDLPEIDVTEPRLLAPRGGFVTLHKRGMLRGCIGYVKAIMPLHKVISECAVSAAVKDYRFPSLQKHELNEIDIEISALSPMKKIEDINQIHVGEHGLYISSPPYTGILLPQVATEYGWDRLTFLAQVCRKAGLPADAWEKGADIFIFSAQVFGEKERQ